MGIGSMFSFLDKLISKLPIQDRKERWKNKIDKLKAERKKITDGEYTEKKGQRLVVIETKIKKLNRLFKNALKVFIIVGLFSVVGCTSAKQKPIQIYWGKAGDMEAYEKAKVVVNNYDWIIMNQEVYQGE